MVKINKAENDKVISFDFYANLLKNNNLVRICNLFRLSKMYMEIYTLKKSKSFLLKLNEWGIKFKAITMGDPNEIIMLLDTEQAIKVNSHLENCDFEDLNVWDCYTDWKQYVYNKEHKVNDSELSGFYLNYNAYHGNRVEIVCNKSYNSITSKDILEEL